MTVRIMGLCRSPAGAKMTFAKKHTNFEKMRAFHSDILF